MLLEEKELGESMLLGTLAVHYPLSHSLEMSMSRLRYSIITKTIGTLGLMISILILQ
jgi:hypothetical protein